MTGLRAAPIFKAAGVLRRPAILKRKQFFSACYCVLLRVTAIGPLAPQTSLSS